MNIFTPAEQRPALIKFARALKSRENALRRDDCGDWHIRGGHGHVYAVPGGYQIFVMGWAAHGWNNAKRALAFAKLINDGDDEGAFFLDRLPTKDEAPTIRARCAIAKKRELGAEQLASLRARGFARAA
jgi:hypothetical protein